MLFPLITTVSEFGLELLDSLSMLPTVYEEKAEIAQPITLFIGNEDPIENRDFDKENNSNPKAETVAHVH